MCVGFVGVLDAIAAVDEITLNRNFHFVMHNVIFKSDNTYDTEYIYRTCLIDSTCIQFCGIDVCLANCSFHVEYRLQLAWYFAIAMSYNVRRDAHMHLYCIWFTFDYAYGEHMDQRRPIPLFQNNFIRLHEIN